jgi:parallel beta-helix repeat protein
MRRSHARPASSNKAWRWLTLAALAGACGGGSAETARGTDGGPPSAACSALETIPESPNEIFVAPDGDDAAAGTSAAAPLQTLAAAVGRFQSGGGTVIVGGGTYPDQEFEAVGTSDTPLVIRAADSETPVFDGSAVAGDSSGVIRLSKAQHVALVGLEIANCSADLCQGIVSPSAVLDLTVRDCDLHDLSGPGMRFHGKTIRLEENHIHDVALVNVNDVAYPTGGWPTCSGTEPDSNLPDDPWTDDVVIRDNDIENCWGEGIGVWFASHAVVEENTVNTAWNVGIYLDNSYQVTVTRNFVSMNRGLNGNGGSGILMATESYAGWLNASASSHDIAITNNIVSAGNGIGWWSSPSTSDANTYGPVQVFHNTVVGFQGGAIGFDPVAAGLPPPAPSQTENNVLYDGGNGGSWLGDPASWRFGSNAWVDGPQPIFADPSDVSLTLTIGTFATPTDAEPLAAQVGTGLSDTGVTTDYACNSRNVAAPTRGAYER